VDQWEWESGAKWTNEREPVPFENQSDEFATRSFPFNRPLHPSSRDGIAIDQQHPARWQEGDGWCKWVQMCHLLGSSASSLLVPSRWQEVPGQQGCKCVIC
jgi:hypothetical protein